MKEGPVTVAHDNFPNHSAIKLPESAIEDGPWSSIDSDWKPHSWSLRASICYTAWDIATLNVKISGNVNRTEPATLWDAINHFYTVPNVTTQLISNVSRLTMANATDRHIMFLEKKDSWIPASEDAGPIAVMPFVQSFGDMSGIGMMPATDGQIPPSYMHGNWSAILTKRYFASLYTIQGQAQKAGFDYIMPVDTLVGLFDDFLENSGSIAQSMSGLITVLSGMAYYEQLPRFAAKTNTTQVFFVDAIYPQRSHGFWAVSIHSCESS